MTLLTLLALNQKTISVFYILYLFWWDEFLKTIFDLARYAILKRKIQNPKIYLSIIKSRLFLLLVYLVFIVVFFALILNWRDTDLVLINFEVLFFKNWLFNFSIITFILREIYNFQNDIRGYAPHHMLSKGIITLHMSLVLGMLFWFLVTKKFMFFMDYATLFSVIPFLLIKLFFEIQEIKNRLIREF